jgi:hypothetical protein
VSTRGQSVFTGIDGRFTLQNVPVIKGNDSVALDVSYLHQDRIVYRGASTAFTIAAGANQNLSGDLILNLSKEADVSPRGSPNGQISLSDWVQIGRFAAGIDAPTSGPEFQKADCAPVDTFGNGLVSLADWVQAGRMAALLDPPVQAQGPTGPIQNPGFNFESGRHAFSIPNLIPRPERIPDQARRVLLSPISTTADERLYAVTLNGRGDENGISFSIEFDPETMRFESGEAVSSSAQIFVNSANAGKIGVGIVLPPGRSFNAGVNRILSLKFKPTGARSSAISFSDLPVKSEVVTIDADEVPAVFGTEATRVIRKR